MWEKKKSVSRLFGHIYRWPETSPVSQIEGEAAIQESPFKTLGEAARNDLSFCGVTDNIVLNLVSGGMELIKIDLRDVNIYKKGSVIKEGARGGQI